MNIPKSCMECSDCKKTLLHGLHYKQTTFTCSRTSRSVYDYYTKRHPDCPVYNKDRYKEEYIPAPVITTDEIERLDNDVFALFDMFVSKFKGDSKLKASNYYFYKDGMKISVKIEKEKSTDAV